MTNPGRVLRRVLLVFVLSALVFECLWTLRSWTLWNGDGEFCCKQTIGKKPFAITLSRCPLSHLGYRLLFQVMRPLTDWWVEDIIALASCAAGVLYFWVLALLVRRVFAARIEQVLYAVFCSCSLLLQVFCGHVEFYPWMCALVMVFAWAAWWHLAGKVSIFWPSAVLTLATAFHSSAVFYFPAVLALEYFRKSSSCKSRSRPAVHAVMVFFLFIGLAVFHRYRWQYAVFLLSSLLTWYTWRHLTPRLRLRQAEFGPWLVILIPWAVYFSIRTILGFYAEPILHHIAPMREPYDHGSFLYTFWSLDHLHDKSLFQWWLSPFAIPAGLLIAWVGKSRWLEDGWLFFLGIFAFSAVAWEILFYPQLRIRDWDLFASTAIPLNLLVGYGVLVFWKRGRIYLALMTLAQLLISVPIILDNSDLLVGRGYATAEFRTTPVSAEVYIRGLPVGRTPLLMENIRSGRARVRLIPSNRNYRSVRRRHVFRPGERVLFKETLASDTSSIPGTRKGEPGR